MPGNNKNKHQKRRVHFAPVSETAAKPGVYDELFPHLASKSTSKSSEKHDSSAPPDYFSEESNAKAVVLVELALSADARKVFDEIPNSVAHFDAEKLKLQPIPVQGNKVKLESKHLDTTTWGFCLVGHLAPKLPDEEGLVQLCDSWNVPYQLFNHASGWHVFKFEKPEHRDQVLLETPYSVSGSMLLLKHMPLCFEFDRDPFRSIPVWIKLHGLPLECWNSTALSMIVSAVGKPILTDERTHAMKMISYARVLVEVDAHAELVSSIEIELPNGRVRQQHGEFDFVPKYCALCQNLGHSSRTCPDKTRSFFIPLEFSSWCD